MSAQARLIFLALVAASGETLYVKVPGNYQPEHCSAFVQARVVPQLMPELGASASGGRAVPDQLCATLGHLYRRARLGLAAHLSDRRGRTAMALQRHCGPAGLASSSGESERLTTPCPGGCPCVASLAAVTLRWR